VLFRLVHAIFYWLKRTLGVGWDARAEAKRKIEFIAAMRVGPHPEAWAAVQSGDANAVRETLASGVDANEADPQGESLLMRAAAGGSTEVVNVLLAAGAEVNHQSFEGNSALHLAVDTAVQFAEYGPEATENRALRTIEALVAAGADTGLRNARGKSPLDWAHEYGPVVERLRHEV